MSRRDSAESRRDTHREAAAGRGGASVPASPDFADCWRSLGSRGRSPSQSGLSRRPLTRRSHRWTDHRSSGRRLEVRGLASSPRATWTPHFSFSPVVGGPVVLWSVLSWSPCEFCFLFSQFQPFSVARTQRPAFGSGDAHGQARSDSLGPVMITPLGPLYESPSAGQTDSSTGRTSISRTRHAR